MLNRKWTIAGVLGAALVAGCSTEQTATTCPPASDASTTRDYRPHLGASDVLGHRFFGRSSERPIFNSTASTSTSTEVIGD